jgi:protein-S-isoprenylcysteine O-methyltransferase Ste14
MHVVDVVILAGWVVFWVYWLAASVGVKAGQTRLTRFAGARVGVILVILLLLRVGALGGHATSNDPWLQGIGLAVFLLGLALAVWARIYLGRNWGTPMSQKVDPELVTTGPYRSIRHPIYSGIILAMIGTTIAVSLYLLVAVAALGAYFLYSAVMEERFMAGLFPDSYPAYKRSSKMLIPFIL